MDRDHAERRGHADLGERMGDEIAYGLGRFATRCWPSMVRRRRHVPLSHIWREVPPEISSWAPVMKPAAGEHRNAMARATSSGSPSRSIGICRVAGDLARTIARGVCAAILACHEAALPLAGIDQPEHHRVHPDARCEFARQRLHQALRAGARRRRGDHVGLRLIGEQRVHRQDRCRIALVQQVLEGAHRMNLAEELQLELLAPGLVAGVRKSRHAGLPGIVDQDIAAPAPLLRPRRRSGRPRPCRGHHIARRGARARRHCRASVDLAAASRDWSRPQIATAAPSARNSRAVASPMPEVPPVTTATLPCSPRSILLIPPPRPAPP